MQETNLVFIDNELKKFNLTDAAIDDLKSKYMPLTINGIVDKEGYKVVNEARKVVKKYRIDIDKRRKELNADALEYQRRINGEARRITALLEPIENHLALEEKKIDDEKERIRREKEIAEAARIQDRINKILSLNFRFNGVYYISNFVDDFTEEEITITAIELKTFTDEAFEAFVMNAAVIYQADNERKAAIEIAKKEQQQREEIERKAENERLEKQRKEQQEQAKALQEQQAEIARQAKEIRLEKEQLEEIKRIEEEKKITQKRREQEMENEILADIEREKIKNAILCVPGLSKGNVTSFSITHENDYKMGFKVGIKAAYDLITLIVYEEFDNYFMNSDHDAISGILNELKDSIKIKFQSFIEEPLQNENN